MKKTEELCPFYLFVFFWDSFVRMMEKFLLISCLPTGIWRTQAQAFFAASHLSHEFTSEQMRLKWVEQEFASVPCGKIQWKVVVFFCEQETGGDYKLILLFKCWSTNCGFEKNMREWIPSMIVYCTWFRS